METLLMKNTVSKIFKIPHVDLGAKWSWEKENPVNLANMNQTKASNKGRMAGP